MSCPLPVERAFSTTFFMSHGERNWPFLMLTGKPALQTLRMKSVCRHRNAGVCSTSTTEATSSSGVYSCTSVSTGTPTCFFTSARMRSPSSRPGPRKPLMEVRLALSKLDLKMKGMPRQSVISFSVPAVSSCNCGDSITQGPAIRKNGRSRPTSKPHRFIPILPFDRHSGQSCFHGGRTARGRMFLPLRSYASRAQVRSCNGSRRSGACDERPASCSPHRFLLGQPRRLAHGLELARGAHETGEQRMALARRGSEFRMELAGQEPRMLLARQFDDLDQVVVGHTGDHQPEFLEALAITVVEFE